MCGVMVTIVAPYGVAVVVVVVALDWTTKEKVSRKKKKKKKKKYKKTVKLEYSNMACVSAETRQGACQCCHASLSSTRLVVGPGGPSREKAAMSVGKEGRVQ